VYGRELDIHKSKGDGIDNHAGDAVEKKPASHISPPHQVDRYIENKINNGNGSLGDEVVNEKRDTGESGSEKLQWEQNGIDGYNANDAARRHEKKIPEDLTNGF
jgi:hypothetical protein